MKLSLWIALFSCLHLLGTRPALSQKLPMDPEKQLTAIRQALVEATLDRPTKVSTNAWIDEKGQLHESSHFQTDARVRGVRVMAYVQDGSTDEPKAQIQLEDLPWSIRMAKAQSGERCEPAPQQWRQPLVISSQKAPGFSGPELYASTQLLGHIEQSVLQLAEQNGRWSVSQAKAAPLPTYQQYWLGRGEEPTGWHLQLQLLPVQKADATPSLLKTWVGWAIESKSSKWTLKATFGQRSSPSGPIQPIWERQLVIDAKAASDIHPDRWVRQLLPELERVFQQWIPHQAHESACDTVQFSVTRLHHQNWLIQAGAGSGLKVGDRVLVLNASKIPGRLLEPGTTQQLAIAEVIRVGRHQSDLRPLAGAVPQSTGDWIALPL
jgi:hypothetical protein